jgi:hypothetical protein
MIHVYQFKQIYISAINKYINQSKIKIPKVKSITSLCELYKTYMSTLFIRHDNRITFILCGPSMQNGVPQGNLCVLTPKCVWTNIDFVMGHETVPMGMMKSNVLLLHRMRQPQAAFHTTQKVNT